MKSNDGLWLCLIFGILGCAALFFAREYSNFRSTRNRLEDLFQKTTNLRELQDLTWQPKGLHGLFLYTRDGKWLAFLYEDPHDGRLWSDVSLALDSQGNWYSSTQHFCGAYDFYEGARLRVETDKSDCWLPQETVSMMIRQKREFDRLRDNSEPNETFMGKIERGRGLEGARDLLRKEGFTFWKTGKLKWMP